MKRILYLGVIASSFVMCKPKQILTDTTSKTETSKSTKKERKIFYIEDVRNDFRAVSEATKNKFLKGYNATESQYSILFFTQGYDNAHIRVENENGILFEGKITSNKQTGLAKNMRIMNLTENEIFDASTRKSIYISPEMAQQYKFIYVMKNEDMEKPYKITYSNLLRPEK